MTLSEAIHLLIKKEGNFIFFINTFQFTNVISKLDIFLNFYKSTFGGRWTNKQKFLFQEIFLLLNCVLQNFISLAETNNNKAISKYLIAF